VSGTIDGEPVEVVVDTELSPPVALDGKYYYAEMVLRTVPQPEPGQVVHLFGDPCAKGACELDITYTAGELDLTPPETPTVYTDVYDHGAVATYTTDGSFCSGNTVEARYSFEMTVLYTQQDTMLYTVGIIDDSNTTIGGVSRWWKLSRFRKDWMTDPKNLESLCGAAQLTDLAGNRSELALACAPCHYQTYNGEPCCNVSR